MRRAELWHCFSSQAPLAPLRVTTSNRRYRRLSLSRGQSGLNENPIVIDFVRKCTN